MWRAKRDELGVRTVHMPKTRRVLEGNSVPKARRVCRSLSEEERGELEVGEAAMGVYEAFLPPKIEKSLARVKYMEVKRMDTMS